MRRKLIMSGVVLALSLSAMADVAPVLSPSFVSSEYNIEQILEAQYGGDFVASGNDYVNGDGVEAIRWDDVLTPIGDLSAVNPVPGSAADQIWRNADITATAIARFSGNTQQFGFDRGNGVELLADVSGYNIAVSGSGSADLMGRAWRWVRRSADGSDAFSSDMGLNADGLDHMITNQIKGVETPDTVWMQCFEDIRGDPPQSDRNFDDPAVDEPTHPGPVTCGLLATGLVGLPLRRRRR